MSKILLTGASGNVGKAILKHFQPLGARQLIKASRTPKTTNEIYFDFENLEKSKESIRNCDILFLLRPPQLANVAKYFKPLIEYCKIASVKHIVFLSVQGAENISFIPHAKIEKLIIQSRLPYTFLRPAYFMQNLTTSFLNDIKYHNEIFVPAGRATFLWIDADDIGKAAAAILYNPDAHANKAYTLTGNELVSFEKVAAMLSWALDREINYVSPNLYSYYKRKKKEGHPASAIMATMLIHYLQRFQKTPSVSQDIHQLTSQEPQSLQNFIHHNRHCWQ